MTCNVDFSTPSATLLSMELDEIIFSGLSASERLVMMFRIISGSVVLDSWTATYYAGTDGRIRLTALGRMWNRYFLFLRRQSGSEETAPQDHPDLLTVEMTYTMEDSTTATCQRRLFYSRRRPDVPLSGLLYHQPLLSKQKATVMGAKEFAWVIPTVSNVTLSVSSYYVLDNRFGTQSDDIAWSGSSSCGGSADVSPSVISALLPSGAKLVEYSTQIRYQGSQRDSCRYVVDYAARLRTEFCWLNRWGVYETLVMRGSETLSPERTAEYGWTGDDWSALDLETADVYEVSTGYVGDREWSQVRDMAESPLVWRWDGQSWHMVTITGVKLDRTKPTNEARACSVTYRPCDREEMYEV